MKPGKDQINSNVNRKKEIIKEQKSMKLRTGKQQRKTSETKT